MCKGSWRKAPEGLFGFRFAPAGETGVYFCVTKSTKSQQRRASRPPLQTSAHLRECAAGSMRAYFVRLPALKRIPQNEKSKLFLISKSAFTTRIIRYICGIFLLPDMGETSALSLPMAFAISRVRTWMPARAEQIHASGGAGGELGGTTKSFARLFQKGLTHVRSTCVGVAETGPRPVREA